MNEGLLRQRRNLFVVCGLFWLLKFGQVEFSKFSFAGFDITFNRPEALYLSLWIAFSYFFYRYYQYFVKFGQAEVIEQYKGALNQLCLSWMSKVHKDHPEWVTNTGYPKFIELIRAKFVVKAEERILVDQVPKGQRNFEVKLNRLRLTVQTLGVLIESTFRSTVVTDYLLPFFFAFFVMLYCGVGDWAGSPLYAIWRNEP